MTGTPPRRRHTPGFGSWRFRAGAAIAVVLLGAFAWLAPVQSGLLVMSDSTDSTLAVVEIVLQSYTDLAQLVTAAFGAIALLLSAQPKSLADLPERVWSSLALSLMLLGAALLLCLGAREAIITMISNNAVDITVPALRFARLSVYGCLTAATILIAKFGIDAMSAPERAEH